jgi:U3 small nucleolar RNA-associated protein 14
LPKKRKLVLPRSGEGIAPEKRHDARLKHVIINEKKIRSLQKYQLEKVPFPFKDKLQYELSQRMPVGKEWNTERSFRKQIRPRVIVTSGRAIAPLKARKKKLAT